MYSSEVFSPYVDPLQVRRSHMVAASAAQHKLKTVVEVIAPPPNVTGELHLGHVLNLCILSRV